MVYAYDTELLTYFSLKGFTFSTREGVVTLHGSLVLCQVITLAVMLWVALREAALPCGLVDIAWLPTMK